MACGVRVQGKLEMALRVLKEKDATIEQLERQLADKEGGDKDDSSKLRQYKLATAQLKEKNVQAHTPALAHTVTLKCVYALCVCHAGGADSGVESTARLLHRGPD